MGQVLFQFWIWSFLLYRLDIVGSLSIDNLMLPFLVLTWFFIGDRRDKRVNSARFRMVVFATLVFFFLIVVDIIKLTGGGQIVVIYPSTIEHLKHFGYILVPLLYISSFESLKWTLFSLMAITVINSGLSALGALGVGPSFVQAAETTRIPGLLRARGPIENLGDTALLLSFIGLLLWTASRHKIQFVGKSLIIKAFVLLVMIAGVIATQSRNVMLTITLVFTVYYWLRIMMQGKRGGIYIFLSFAGIAFFLVAVMFIFLNADTIISWVTNVFGVSGVGTVRDRLTSYKHAIALLDGSLLFGLSPRELTQNVLFIAKLHNMWLGMALFSGLFGVVLVFAMIIVSMLSGLRLIRDSYWNEYGLVFTSFILASLWFSPNFYPGHNAFLFWFCVGFGLTARQTIYFAPKVERNVLTKPTLSVESL